MHPAQPAASCLSLPSPPDSPSLDPYDDADVDSLSVFFSSGAGSPHSHPHSGAASHPHSGQLRHLHLHDHDHGHDTGLIIPSLTLPHALDQPTPYGQTLGEVSLLLVGPAGAGTAHLAAFLADMDDVLDAGAWEPVEGGGARILRCSTDWIEERDPHGLERFEGTANVSFLEFDGFDAAEKNVVENVLRHIHDVFRDVRSQLDNSPSSPLLHSLLASSHSPLHTALIYVTATPLTTQDHTIISALASTIPIIPFSTSCSSTALSFARHLSIQPKLSFFQPRSRSRHSAQEAADRFMRWREVERAVADRDLDIANYSHFKSNSDDLSDDCARDRDISQPSTRLRRGAGKEWSKAAWEASLSEDIARRFRQLPSHPFSSVLEKGTSSTLAETTLFSSVTPCFAPTLDPLHLRSLMLLSFTLFAPRAFAPKSSIPKSRLGPEEMAGTSSTLRPYASGAGSGKGARDDWRAWRWGLAVVGVFCAGLGIGLGQRRTNG
ncbi:hypothetical protein DFH11DRAFT_1689732 [Phellopilus nigrolimitatus]|nr:hypothetical protein DFH11DRAFT_1689732 [Phellopilus nigrolimitatus]